MIVSMATFLLRILVYIMYLIITPTCAPTVPSVPT